MKRGLLFMVLLVGCSRRPTLDELTYYEISQLHDLKYKQWKQFTAEGDAKLADQTYANLLLINDYRRLKWRDESKKLEAILRQRAAELPQPPP